MTQDSRSATTVKITTSTRLRLIVEAVQAKTSLPDLIGQYVPLRRVSDHRFIASCPLHQDESSLTVSDAGWYFCEAPSCGVRGDVLSFYSGIEGGVSLSMALRELAERVGIDVPDRIDLSAPDDHIRLGSDLTALGLIAREEMISLEAGVATQRALSALRVSPDLLDSDDGRAIVAEAIDVPGEELRRYACSVTSDARTTTSEARAASATKLAAALATIRRAKADLRVQRVRSERAYANPFQPLDLYALGVEHDNATWRRR